MAKHKIVYPQGADQRILKRGYADLIKERQRRFAAEHEEFLRDSENEAKMASASFALLDRSPEQIEKAGKQFAANRKYVQSRQPKRLPPPPPSGHNPVRYPPYDLAWEEHHFGSIQTHILYGPNASNGLIGANLFSLSGGGGGSSQVHVGNWHYSPVSDSCYVSVQARIAIGWGYTAAIGGNGRAYAGLRLTVWDLSSGDVYSTTRDIFDRSSHIVGFHQKTFPSNQIITAGMYIVTRADAWYAIEAAAVQRVYASGALADGQSHFALYVSPFTVNQLIIT